MVALNPDNSETEEREWSRHAQIARRVMAISTFMLLLLVAAYCSDGGTRDAAVTLLTALSGRAASLSEGAGGRDFTLSSGKSDHNHPSSPNGRFYQVDLSLPASYDVGERQDNMWLCTSMPFDRPFSLLGVVPRASQELVHHIKLFGCRTPASQAPVWDCKQAPICQDTEADVLYAWGRDAPPFMLPEDTSFSVGTATMATMVMQVHYLRPPLTADQSGLRLYLTDQAMTFAAGMLSFNFDFMLPPGRGRVSVGGTCCYSGWEPLIGFAMRAHTHALGREVWLHQHTPGSSVQTAVGVRDPELPQAFYPVDPATILLPGDRLTTTCHFNTSMETRIVRYGTTHKDEMCNVYLMTRGKLPFFLRCGDGGLSGRIDLSGPGGLPESSVGLVAITDRRLWHPPEVTGTQRRGGMVGQVTGLANGHDGTVWVLHRGEQAWHGAASDAGRDISKADLVSNEPLIPGDVVLQLDQGNGALLQAWGSNTFLVPYGMTHDWEGNLWITDVGLHQAIKFNTHGTMLMELGRPRIPGTDKETFCGPTHVAVGRDGSVYVSDGLCHPQGRVVKFDADGHFQREYRLPHVSPKDSFSLPLPHSMMLDECHAELLVADLNRGRVLSIDLKTGDLRGNWDLGASSYGLPYALALGPYGHVVVLTWDRGEGGGAAVMALGTGEQRHYRTPSRVWKFTTTAAEVQSPHALALIAEDKEVRLLVGEARAQGKSRIVKLMFNGSHTHSGDLH